MYKRIAVAVDGSDTSTVALSEAVKLAKLTGAEVLLLHVCEEIPVTWGIEGIPALPLDDVEKALAEAGRRLLHRDKQRVQGEGIAVETRLVEDYAGRTGAVISEEAARWLADLLVVGTHGRKGLDRMLMGSVAENVMRTATMPLLLVRG